MSLCIHDRGWGGGAYVVSSVVRSRWTDHLSFPVPTSYTCVSGAGLRVQGAGFRVQGAGFRVQGAGCRVQGAGFRVQGTGFRVQDSGSHPTPPPETRFRSFRSPSVWWGGAAASHISLI